MNWFHTPLRRELPWLALAAVLLVVLLHANANPERLSASDRQQLENLVASVDALIVKVAELEKNGHLHQLQILHHRGQRH